VDRPPPSVDSSGAVDVLNVWIYTRGKMIRSGIKKLDLHDPEQLGQFLIEDPAYGEFCRDNLQDIESFHGLRILEIGCGDGFFSVWCANQGAEVNGVDKRRTALGNARELASVHGVEHLVSFSKENVEELPFDSESFDIVSSQSVLQYTNRTQVIEECLRVLKPGGKLMLAENLPFNPGINVVRAVKRLRAKKARDIEYLQSIKGYFRYSEAKILASRMDDAKLKTKFLVQILTFLWLRLRFLPGRGFISILDRGLQKLDRMLLRLFPPLAHFCWIISVTGKKRTTSEEP